VEIEGARWALLGDQATVDAEGVIHFLGRGSVCINSGGEKIYPEEVEAAIKSHDAVQDAVVAGIPDERWGQRVAAVVSARRGATVTLDELNEHLDGRIARYKVPRFLHVVDEVRRSPSGKCDYRWARGVLADAASGKVGA
jgi:3-oxocholest-4-en-26-oate---CoA ligase